MPADQPDPASARRIYRAGDHVLHHGTGEKWLLACDEQDGEIVCCGWPETYAPAAGVDLVRAATDEERLQVLRDVARLLDQRRGSIARAQLAAEEAPDAR